MARRSAGYRLWRAGPANACWGPGPTALGAPAPRGIKELNHAYEANRTRTEWGAQPRVQGERQDGGGHSLLRGPRSGARLAAGGGEQPLPSAGRGLREF